MTQDAPTLFDYAARDKPVHGGLRYPVVAGYKKEGTSQLSANSIEKESKTLRDSVWRARKILLSETQPALGIAKRGD